MSFKNRITHTLSSPIPEEFAASYHDYLLNLFISRLNVGYLFCIILIPSAFIFDILVFPDKWPQLLMVRLVSMVSCLLLFCLSNYTILKKYPSQMCQVLNIVVAGTIAYLVFITGAYKSPYYAGFILIFICIAMVLPWGVSGSFVAGLVIIFIHFTLNLFPILLKNSSLVYWPLVWNSIYFLTFSFILVIISSGIFESTRRQIFVSSQQEKIRSKKLEESRNEIDTLLKNKSRFIANITHELKTPLSIVIGNSEIFMERVANLDKTLSEQLQIIHRAAFQLAMHVDRIIGVASTDDPDQQLSTANYDYVGVVEHIFSLFEARAKDEKISYSLNIPSSPLVINADVVRIEEVLNNLIQNAFKFVDTGQSITVTVGTDGEEIFTEVADTGCGISEDLIGKVFGRLFQVDDVLSKRHGGIGVGLYLCKRNVELHGGKIHVQSKVGKGTSFRFTLPLYVDQNVNIVKTMPDIDEERRTSNSRRAASDRRMSERIKKFEYQQTLGLDSLAKMAFSGNVKDFENQDPSSSSILVIEDNPGMMKVIVDALFEDYNLFIAEDGFEALEKLKENAGKISLILSDIMMPGMSGFDFCKKVMESKEHQHIPLIFVSALLNEADQLKGYSLGATDYIIKPYNIKILKEKVAHWISRRKYEMVLHDISDSLEQRVKETSRLKDIIMHEINNPLQVITTANYMLQKQKEMVDENPSELGEKVSRNVEMLDKGIQAMRSVMQAAKSLESLQLSSKRPEYVRNLFDDTLSQCSHLLQGVFHYIDTGKDLFEERVLCEKKMLTQVFVNLVRNATEAIQEKNESGEGIIRITAERTERNHVLFRIEDNGVGIPQEILRKLFRFKYTTKKDGTGIGLHVSKMIVRLHDGDISVKSEEGSGTSVLISLPLFEEPENGTRQRAFHQSDEFASM